MNSPSLKSAALLAGTTLVCFGFMAAARAEDSVTFTGGYTTVFSNSDGGSRAANYRTNIEGKSSASSGAICNSYKDAIIAKEAWNTDACQTPSPTAGNFAETLFGNPDGFSGYAEVAALGSMMSANMSTSGSLSGITQPEFASAIWDITIPGNVNSLDVNSTALAAAVGTSFYENSNAVPAYLRSEGSLWILTPNQHPGFGFNPQRINIRHLKVSEGGDPLLYMFLAMLSVFGALFVGRRRAQMAR